VSAACAASGSAGEAAKIPRISRVKFLKQTSFDSAWVLAPALFDSKGRIRRDHVMIEGRDEAHPEDSYFLVFRDQGKRKREAVRPDAFVPADRSKHRQAELSAIRSGLIETPVIVEAAARTKISDVLDKYTNYIQFHRSLRTYRLILKFFGEFALARTWTRSAAPPSWNSQRTV
jgi:hypothetical protein